MSITKPEPPLSQDKQAIEAEIAKLKTEIARHNLLYYEFANPEISDYDYDQLAARLQALEKEPGSTISESSSPIQKVGSDLSQGAIVIPHKARMYSLDNAYSLEEVSSFIMKLNQETSQENQYCAEL
ncbi:MAG: hypothetical protein PHO32_09435, partial [Candidatus Cloacimonetes bacterium]|nr:hypothetical protein [Candidatus Cloacimonadota bacterium]